MKNIKFTIVLMFLQLLYAGTAGAAGMDAGNGDNDGIVVAYVTSWSRVMPDTKYMTHINYAFGHVSETFDGVGIANEERFARIALLKRDNPKLKVLLSIGGWGSGRFSEMAASKKNRKAFAKDCNRIVRQYGIDGIDIDWEYPTSSAANISSSPKDTENYTLLMQELRKAIGKNKLLTLATVASAKYINFRDIMPYVDFVNIMSYDMGYGARHHAGLYPSQRTGGITASQAVEAHLAAGVPASKLVMGLPFYGRGMKEYSDYMDYRMIGGKKGYAERWDDEAKVPYLVDKKGDFVFGYDNPRSLAIKCDYIRRKGLLGAMYWEYAGDNDRDDLRRTVCEGIMKRKPANEKPARVIVLAECQGQHKPFTDAAIGWLEEASKAMNFDLQVEKTAKLFADKSVLASTDLVIQLDFPPYTWPKEAEDNFINYMSEGRGAWIGFHHATLLGDFDGYPMWRWFSDFMGGIAFRNYVAKLADGTVKVEDATHPVMQNLDKSFVLKDDEWYTYDRSPRSNVRVLASVDEDSYTPATDIKMGDHPVVWTNEHVKTRNVYFLFGHSPKLFESDNFTTMFANALKWALKK